MTPRKPPAQPLTLAQAAQLSGLTIAALRMRIKRGVEPEGYKQGRDWFLPGNWTAKQLNYTRKAAKKAEVTK